MNMHNVLPPHRRHIMKADRYVLITPARDEEKYIEQTIQSVLAQTRRPAEWLIVDDGSTDRTAEIIVHAAASYDWIRLIRTSDRGARMVGAGVVEAFNCGLAAMNTGDPDFLCKLDADLVLPADYFERLMKYFQTDPQLGIASGPIVERVGNRFEALRGSHEVAFGAAKFYRRTCFEAIGGLEQSVGWDGIDCYQAMRRGWRTAMLPDPRLTIIHLRRMGSSHKNVLHGCSRRGRGLHYNRAHPVWVLASAAYRMLDRPYIVAGVCVLFGYFAAAVSHAPRISDVEFGSFLRSWQMKKLARTLWRGFPAWTPSVPPPAPDGR